MPPDRFTRSAHHSVPRRPACPTGAVTPARLARTPILTGSAGTPGRVCARVRRGRASTPPAARVAPAPLRNSRLVAAMSRLPVAESVAESRDTDEAFHQAASSAVHGDRLRHGSTAGPERDGGGHRQDAGWMSD